VHPKKAEILATVEHAATTWDAMMHEALHVISHPTQYTLRGALGAASLLPLMGVNLLLVDLNWVLVARTPDETWQRAYPPPPDNGPDHDRTT
jgi:hypothetical protein